MTTELTIYQCADIITQMDKLAANNDGEISDEDLQALVEAHTTAITKLGNLCGYMQHLSGGIDLCKQEESRIASMRKRAERRLESIKRFLVPFVSQYRTEKGHPLTVGTFTLSTRKSTSVEVDDLNFFTDENKIQFCVEKIAYQPDKAAIKEALQSGQSIIGARLSENESLQVK